MHGNPIFKKIYYKLYCRTRVTKFENRSAIKCRFMMYVTEIETGCWEIICGLFCTQVPNTSQPNPPSLQPTSQQQIHRLNLCVQIILFFCFSGPKALYKGLGPTLVRTFPATGSLFLAYETTKKFLTNLADGR